MRGGDGQEEHFYPLELCLYVSFCMLTWVLWSKGTQHLITPRPARLEGPPSHSH